MRPETVGQPSTTYVLGKLSGRNGLRKRLEDLGFHDVLSDAHRFDRLFARFKSLADTKAQVVDADLVALVCDEPPAGDVSSLDELQAASSSPRKLFTLKRVQVVSSTAPDSSQMATATATITIGIASMNGASPVERTDAAIGNGPVHAIFTCISRLLDEEMVPPVALLDYEVSSVTSGGDALGKVTVRLGAVDDAQQSATAEPLSSIVDAEHAHSSRRRFHLGHGVHRDVLTASAFAYIDAMNKLRDAEDLRVVETNGGNASDREKMGHVAAVEE